MSASKKENDQPRLKIALLGLGLDNRALLELLAKQKMAADVTVCDAREKSALKLQEIKIPQDLKLGFRLGREYNKELGDFDVLVRSPGWPLRCPGIKEALKKGHTAVTSPINIFLSLAPTKKIIGVTGTKGKGTTASLIYQILRQAGKSVWLGGNIGISPLSFLTRLQPADYVVLELSSFQLEDLAISPKIAVLTNLFPEHLAAADPFNPNFHPSFKAYWQAKLNIARFAPNEYLVINQNLRQKVSSEKLAGRKIFFSPLPLASRLAGRYNQENIGAAVAVAKLLKIKPGSYKKTIANFRNLEHRLELVRTLKGVQYFDNSFSTTPESTILDLQSFSAPIIQLAGGADKGADFRPLAKEIARRVRFLILLPGQATPRLKKAIQQAGFPKSQLIEVKNMPQAVAWSAKKARPGEVVLLSTACASFGIFKNYKERGNLFKQSVKQLV